MLDKVVDKARICRVHSTRGEIKIRRGDMSRIDYSIGAKERERVVKVWELRDAKKAGELTPLLERLEPYLDR